MLDKSKNPFRKLLTRLEQLDDISDFSDLTDIKLELYVRKNMKDYGEYVVENRAIPDFRDGLKPVHRRILYSMYKQGFHASSKFHKAAKISGHVIGNYHPHGEMAVSSAMVNMTNAVKKHNDLTIYMKNNPVPFIYGLGNWGDHNSEAAAFRYIECKLSKFSGSILLDPEYLEVTDMVSNYDASTTEPLILPSKLPILLMSGSYGIGVGTTTKIPPFKPEGLIKLIQKSLKSEKLSYKDCKKNLEFNYIYDPIVIEEKSELKEFYETGKGAVQFRCGYSLNEKTRTLLIEQLTPDFNFDNFNNKVILLDTVYSVDETSDKNSTKFQVTFKPKVDYKSDLEKIKKMLEQRISFKFNITERYIEKTDDLEEQRARFSSTNVIDFIEKWTDYRVELELKYLNNKKNKVENRILYLELLRYAISKLDIIFKVLKSKTKNIDSTLADKLDIPLEDAKTILGLQVRKLSKLSDDELLNEIKEKRKELKQINKWIKYPEDKIYDDLEDINLYDNI